VNLIEAEEKLKSLRFPPENVEGELADGRE
jgi:hypothetical protein